MRNLYETAEDGATGCAGYYFPPAPQGKTEVGGPVSRLILSCIRPCFISGRNKIGKGGEVTSKAERIDDTPSLESILSYSVQNVEKKINKRGFAIICQ